MLYFISQAITMKGAIYSNANGNWNSSSTWLKNGVPAIPACGDTIYIQSNHTITVQSQETYLSCPTPLYIYVSGILQFTNGSKLDLSCGSFVSILTGGTVKKSTPGGGNSTLISICGATLWNAAAGPLTGNTYLPVSLIFFEGKEKNGDVFLNWCTASEINNDYFIIQRTQNDHRFERIGVVDGSGSTNIMQHYSFADNEPPYGRLYYQLCQVDFNGSRLTYPTISVFVNKNMQCIIYPNPSSGNYISLLFRSEAAANYRWKLTDINGQLLSEKEGVFDEEGFNTILLSDYYKFRHGAYFLTFSTEDKIFHKQIIVN